MAHILAGTDGPSVAKGAYIIKKEDTRLDAVLISTGIDLTTTYLIKEELRAKGYDTRLVSMPSVELFLAQPQEYQDEVIPPEAQVFTIEASATLPWYRFASKGCAIGVDTFGASGTKEDVLEKVQFDYETILSKIEENIKNKPEESVSLEMEEEIPLAAEESSASEAAPVEVAPTEAVPTEVAPSEVATNETTPSAVVSSAVAESFENPMEENIITQVEE